MSSQTPFASPPAGGLTPPPGLFLPITSLTPGFSTPTAESLAINANRHLNGMKTPGTIDNEGTASPCRAGTFFRPRRWLDAAHELVDVHRHTSGPELGRALLPSASATDAGLQPESLAESHTCSSSPVPVRWDGAAPAKASGAGGARLSRFLFLWHLDRHQTLRPPSGTNVGMIRQLPKTSD